MRPGWDDWPPAVPPSDDYLIDPGPSVDLWSESWADEAARQPPAHEPPAHEPPAHEPPAHEPPAYIPPDEMAGLPDVTAPGDRDPLEAVAEPEVVEQTVAAPGSWADAQSTWSTTGPGQPTAPLPDWLAEPEFDEPTEPWPEPASEEAPAPSAAEHEPTPDADPEFEPEPTTEPVPEPGLGADEAPPRAAFSWVSGASAAMPDFLEPEPSLAPEAEPEPEPGLEVQPQVEPVAELDREPEPEPEPASEPDLAGEPAQDPGAVPEPEPSPRPATDTWPQPAEDRWPIADAAPPPESAWTDDADSTRVFPTSWTPPPPPPPLDDLEPQGGDIRTSLGGPDAEAAPAGSTAEQAVPWLIGLVLLLAGMVIVLLALIFAGDGSLGARPTSPASLAAVLPSQTPEPSRTPLLSPSPAVVSAAPSETAPGLPDYGPLEMVYQGRSAALAPIYLLMHDFTTDNDPTVLAQDPNINVRRFDWSPDGKVGVGVLEDFLVSIEPGVAKRTLAQGVSTVTFGERTADVYAVRITRDGGNDVATVLDIDFTSGDTTELASVSYERPDIASEKPLPEAQFTDDGGTIRLFWMHDGTLRLWVLGASTWRITTGGEVTDLESDRLPVLFTPDGSHRIDLVADADTGRTELRYIGADAKVRAVAMVDGLVSHLRWSRAGDRVVFTVGHSSANGGVVQDLFLWNLETAASCTAAPGASCQQITDTGAAFGATWRGTTPRWADG